MIGAKRQFARPTALLIVLALCWPMATALAAASAPVLPACCMRMSHACHVNHQSGDTFQAVCRTCGWCHALPNAPAHLSFTAVTFSFSIYHAAANAGSTTQPSLSVSRLHASRAPPPIASATEAS